jgi:hypothetical protein
MVGSAYIDVDKFLVEMEQNIEPRFTGVETCVDMCSAIIELVINGMLRVIVKLCNLA